MNYEFLDGPPFINGKMHHGHALVSSIKDTILRHKENQGYNIDFNFGFDEHGLPLEQAVEKELNQSKLDLSQPENLELFCNTARNIIEKYTQMWIESFRKLNRKIDITKQYHTSNIDYMNSLWKNFYILHQKGLIYQSYKVMPYSPKLGCSLSNFEANSNYQEISDNTITVKFPIVDKLTDTVLKNYYFLAWTTTPWSLVGNMGLGVNSEINYCCIKFKDEYYYLAENLVVNNFKEGTFEIIKKGIKGNELVNSYSYRPIFNHLIDIDYSLYNADYITDISGTGIVHLAPMFGQDDFNTINKKDLPLFLDPHLNFTYDFTLLNISKGSFLLDIEVPVIKYLAHNNLLFSKKKIKHQYPMCWRTDTKLIYYANTSWFLNVSKIKKNLIKNVMKIKWHPKEVAVKRFNNWVANSIDWCLSRNRVWGTPLPILVNKVDSSDIIFIKSKEYLEEIIGKKINDLHLDTLNKINFIIKDKEYKIMGDVFDCWYESGMACVVNNKHNDFQPYDFITESLDQTRGWFYTLNVVSTALFNKPAFKNVKVSGLILAEDGKKMSKRLMNYTNPIDLIEKYDADSLRLYLISSPASKGEPFKFNNSHLEKLYKKFIPIENGIKMYIDYGLYIDNKFEIGKLTTLDTYIIQQINNFCRMIDNKLNQYDTSNLDKEIIRMIDVICNRYIRLSRDRMNFNLGNDEYQLCFRVLNYVLYNFSESLKAILPSKYNRWKTLISKNLQSEYIYNFYADDIDEIDFDICYQVIELGRRLRDKHKIRFTMPISNITVYLMSTDIIKLKPSLSYIKQELNIEHINIVDINKLPCIFKPHRGTVGKFYKKETKQICQKIINAKSEDDLVDIKNKFYYREIQIKNTDELKYCQDDQIVVELSYIFNDIHKIKEQLILLKKNINNVKKEMGINWFDKSILLIKDSPKLEEYSWYLEELNLKFKFSNNIENEIFNFNNWYFSILKL
tara:strand:+ start:779 stop:3658 length:2880 start_codon:yes stop_codon:yes gene_type:complete